MTAEHQEKDQARQVTKMLADADFLFSVTRGPEEKTIWTLPFNDPVNSAGPQLQVNLHILGATLVVWWYQDPPLSSQNLQPSQLLELLKANFRLAFAKIALNEVPNIIVWAQVPLAMLGPEVLREAIGGVLIGVAEVRRIVTPASPASPG